MTWTFNDVVFLKKYLKLLFLNNCIQLWKIIVFILDVSNSFTFIENILCLK